MLCASCVIYPRELRKSIISPSYDEWESGYSETSPEIIMAQELDTYTAVPTSPTGGDFEYSPYSFETYFDNESDSSEYPIHWLDLSQPHRPITLIVDDPIIRMSDLIEYQIECYNDSTLIEVHKTPNRSINDMLNGSYSLVDACMWPRCHTSHYSNVWHHREPTFVGFIQWIKTQQ